jgi:glutamine amidotransferase
MIAIVDYGVGNLGAIANMLKRVGASGVIASDPAVIAKADKLILPGVGAFDAAMQRIHERHLEPVLADKALRDRVPVLGICLGMQLLTESSEEGHLPGLGWIPGKTLAFRGRIDGAVKVPHMGWNLVAPETPSALTEGLHTVAEPRFYFVHSYFVHCEDRRNSILRTTYGVPFDAAIQQDNIYGVQFHPEKSHRFGMKLLENFTGI